MSALAIAACLLMLAAAGWVAIQPHEPAPITTPEVTVSTVTRVVDGDTVEVELDGEIVQVRLAEIDAPESNQAWGDRSEAVLTRLTLDKPVRIEGRGRDRYGRLIGRIYVGDVDVSARMIEEGCAWAYRAHLTDDRLLETENKARRSRTGLWAQSSRDIVAPWDWRRGERTEAQPVTFADASPLPSAASGFTCDARKTCGQMASCEEAVFQLNQCGATRIDGDGDGVPCEALCRQGF
ncbi:nuclease [Caulobacter sp. SLTY]|uniref:thermonuclease family protein n=1 Tax=Caulobacter sp. SLTY TaxID=2683262 RepID=UPI0014125EF8|nr:thermonuclease family protein [Caulobacter sp. SLTY]NBB15832.1 nuclease [Caulobacter sp. SLTY]